MVVRHHERENCNVVVADVNILESAMHLNHFVALGLLHFNDAVCPSGNCIHSIERVTKITENNVQLHFDKRLH